MVRYTVQSTQMLQAIIDRNTAWFQSFQRAEDAGRSGLGDSGMDIVSVSSDNDASAIGEGDMENNITDGAFQDSAGDDAWTPTEVVDANDTIVDPSSWTPTEVVAANDTIVDPSSWTPTEVVDANDTILDHSSSPDSLSC